MRVTNLLYLIFSFLCISVNAQRLGGIDTSFNSVFGFNGYVEHVLQQPDGKIVVYGGFSKYGTKSVNRLVRLNAPGVVDPTFNTEFSADSIIGMKINSSGQILMLWEFYELQNWTYSVQFEKLNSDGSRDETFAPAIKMLYLNESGCILLNSGKVIISGYGIIDEDTAALVVRLNEDGSIDQTFSLDEVISSNLNNYPSFVEVSDDKLIGYFNNQIFRINADGSLDNTFHSVTIPANKGGVSLVRELPGGKIFLCGNFTEFDGNVTSKSAIISSTGNFEVTLDYDFTLAGNLYVAAVQTDAKIIVYDPYHYKLIRFNSDGTVDAGYESTNPIYPIKLELNAADELMKFQWNSITVDNADGTFKAEYYRSGIDYYTSAISALADNKLLVGGFFIKYGNTRRSGLLKLNEDGTFDQSYTLNVLPEYSSKLNFIKQQDGRILLYGFFSSIGGTPRINAARLNSDASLDMTFNPGAQVGGGHISFMSLSPVSGIFLAGDFTSYSGTARNRLAKIDLNGILDNAFVPELPDIAYVDYVKELPNGKVMVSGRINNDQFTLRLNADGSRDNTFQLIQRSIGQLEVLESGQYLVIMGDQYDFYKLLTRVNPDGTIDGSFVQPFYQNGGSYHDGFVTKFKLLNNGKILLSVVGTQIGSGLYVLNADGSIDYSYQGVKAEGIDFFEKVGDRIYIGGTFSICDGYQSPYVARVYDKHPAKNIINGTIFTDANADCVPQLSETRLNSYVVKAEPGPYFASTNARGNYSLEVDTGSVSLTLTQQFNSFTNIVSENQCQSSYNIDLSGSGKDTSSFNFADTIITCYLPFVEIESFRHRRCFKGETKVLYGNKGNEDLHNVEIKITYPEYVQALISSPEWTSRSGRELSYTVAMIAAGTTGQITITDSVVCGIESIRGLTQCIKAEIVKAQNCVPENINWDHASVTVSGSCESGTGKFRIWNQGTGDMEDSLNYRVFFNDTLVSTKKFKLISNTYLPLDIVSAGKTVRAEADQSPYHPGTSRPRAFLEGCGGNAWNGFVSSSAQDDQDPEIAISCLPIVDSYDPNDKQSSITGTGVLHRIKPGTEMDYTIRFQNTGSDYAYTVIIVDTLDDKFDPSSFAPGLSSHPYTLQVSGKGRMILRFIFSNIMLPDSSVDQAGSNGFVKFRIRLSEDAPLESMVNNFAGIFFDYNSAIITNTVTHTISNIDETNPILATNVQEGQVVVGTKDRREKLFRLYPNPTADVVNIQASVSRGTLRLVSNMGIEVLTLVLAENVTSLDVSALPKGVYLYTIISDSGVEGGKLILR